MQPFLGNRLFYRFKKEKEMKNLVLVFAAFAAISFASCGGNKNANNENCGSTACCDSVKCDSAAVACCDSVKCDSACVK